MAYTHTTFFMLLHEQMVESLPSPALHHQAALSLNKNAHGGVHASLPSPDTAAALMRLRGGLKDSKDAKGAAVVVRSTNLMLNIVLKDVTLRFLCGLCLLFVHTHACMSTTRRIRAADVSIALSSM